MELSYDPALLSIYPKKIKTGYQRNSCSLMFIAALFTVAKIWKHPKCQSVDEWVNKRLWSVLTHSGILFSYEREGDPAIRSIDGPCRRCADE